MNPEIFPNITWEAESKKPMTGTEWQRGQASFIRNAYAAVADVEPISKRETLQHWLTACLYSCNMENFNAK